jgi:hypothetical protein
MIWVPIQQLAAGLENARIPAAKQVFRVDEPQHSILRECPDVALRPAIFFQRFRAGHQKCAMGVCTSLLAKYPPPVAQAATFVQNTGVAAR